MKRHKITKVDEGGIAEELGIEEGDFLLAINDKEIEDIFDYDFIVNDEYLEVLIEKANGEEWLLEVEKDYDEDLGMEFGESLMDEYRSCFNKCVFCFIDQNPPGMRETIYFKDDDTRLSFLQGNYVTLTNMKEKDIQRIIDYKLAPINISVHTTNPELRCQMLHNRFAGKVMDYIQIQTNLKWGEQKRVFSMIPGLEHAEFIRYGVMHRNTFLESPAVLTKGLYLKEHPNVFFAGQITGFEGYMESAASGLLAARNLYARLQGRELPPPPTTTMCGALIDYITTPNKDFQPMGANMGILPRTEEIDTIRDKRERYMALSDAAQAAMRAWAAEAEH